MSCEACREAETLDSQTPPCKTPEGCQIPPSPRGYERHRRIYDHCQALKDLAATDSIFRLHHVTIDDLDFLAVIHRETQGPQE